MAINIGGWGNAAKTALQRASGAYTKYYADPVRKNLNALSGDLGRSNARNLQKSTDTSLPYATRQTAALKGVGGTALLLPGASSVRAAVTPAVKATTSFARAAAPKIANTAASTNSYLSRALSGAYGSVAQRLAQNVGRQTATAANAQRTALTRYMDGVRPSSTVPRPAPSTQVGASTRTLPQSPIKSTSPVSGPAPQPTPLRVPPRASAPRPTVPPRTFAQRAGNFGRAFLPTTTTARLGVGALGLGAGAMLLGDSSAPASDPQAAALKALTPVEEPQPIDDFGFGASTTEEVPTWDDTTTYRTTTDTTQPMAASTYDTYETAPASFSTMGMSTGGGFGGGTSGGPATAGSGGGSISQFNTAREEAIRRMMGYYEPSDKEEDYDKQAAEIARRMAEIQGFVDERNIDLETSPVSAGRREGIRGALDRESRRSLVPLQSSLALMQAQREMEEKRRKQQLEGEKMEYGLRYGELEPKQESFTLGEGQVRYEYNPQTGQYQSFAGAPKAPDLPSAAREYQYAVQNGYQGSFLQYQRDMKGAADNIVKINGTDYIQNPDGSLSLPNVPEKVSETAQNQIATAFAALQSAKQLASAAGRGRSWLESVKQGLVGATDYTNLESYANTLRTSILSLATDPEIKRFFGPQMSNADVQLMTSAGTALNPELMGPAQFAAELTRLEEVLTRLVNAKQAAGGDFNW